VLLDEKIDMNSRRPYLRFFLWAWLNSDVSLDSTRIEEIQYDKEIWQFFTLLCKFTNVFMKKVCSLRLLSLHFFFLMFSNLRT